MEQIILQSHLSTLAHLECEKEAVTEKIEEIATTEPYAEPVQRLQCLKGVGVYTAMVLVTEIGDIRRFATAPQLMSYFGLVPSEHSSGEHRSTKSITKTGNAHGRRVLGQAAWNQCGAVGRSKQLLERWQGQQPEVVAIARKAERRLHKKYWKIAYRKDHRKAATAVAREMAGFVWALLSLSIA
jgi:transposase